MSEQPNQAVSTDAVVELLRGDRVTTFTVAGEGPNPLRLQPGADPFALDTGDLLVDVDLGLSVNEARQRAQRAGVWLPLPEHPGTLLEFFAAAPPWVDAFVRDLDGLDRDGARCASPSSPRAAVGPDLVGGALLPRLWLLPLRARVRVVSQAHVRLTSIPMKDAALCARAVVDVMNEGRAFFLAATSQELRITYGTSSTADRPEAVRVTQPLPAVHVRRGTAVSGASVDAIAEQLAGDGMLIGAPQQGRLLWLDGAAPPAVTFGPLDGTASALATSLGAAVDGRAAAHAPRSSVVLAKEPRHA